MIHDATVEVSCDGDRCYEHLIIEPEFKYPNYSGKGGSYDTSDSALEEKIEHEGWFVQDGKHYCSEACVPNANQS